MSRYGATLFTLSIAKFTMKLPRWHDSVGGGESGSEGRTGTKGNSETLETRLLFAVIPTCQDWRNFLLGRVGEMSRAKAHLENLNVDGRKKLKLILKN
jgi:hypothetical protein